MTFTYAKAELLAYGLALLVGSSIVYLSLTGQMDWAADDYWHLCALENRSFEGGPAPDNLFRFFSGVPEENLAAMREGAIPWYADPTAKVTFFRPLTTALHRLDHFLFGMSATGAKVHSLLWYLALIFVVARLFRDMLPPPVNGVSILIFAVTSSHWQGVAWIAARNATITAVFALGAVLCHLRWRQGRWRHGAVGAAICLVCGLAAGEAALGALAYIVAYEAWGREDRSLRNFTAVVPVASVATIWLFFHAVGGYGTNASGAYLDPLAEPFHFLAELPARLTSLVGMAYLAFPADLWFLEPQVRPLASATGGVAVLLVASLLWPTLRGSRSTVARSAIVLGAGSLLAMIPQAAGFLGARSLTLPSFGASAIIGLALVVGVRSLRQRETRGWVRGSRAVAFATLAITSVLVAVPSWFATSLYYVQMTETTERVVRALPTPSSDEEIWIVVHAPDPFLERYLPFQRRVAGLPTPAVWRTLSMARSAHVVSRTAPDAFELQITESQLLSSPFEQLFRARGDSLRVGQGVDLGDMQVRVLTTNETGPTSFELRFDRSLEDPTLKFFVWQGEVLAPFRMPPIGDTVHLPWHPGPLAL